MKKLINVTLLALALFVLGGCVSVSQEEIKAGHEKAAKARQEHAKQICVKEPASPFCMNQ
jgi:outer membrane biogenesis lipoprotein LolB